MLCFYGGLLLNSNIKSVVSRYPLLSVQLNVGDRHRIVHSGLQRGSLWIRPRARDFRVLVTGEAETVLYHYMLNDFGPHVGEDQGRKFWIVPDVQDVEHIISQFGAACVDLHGNLTRYLHCKVNRGK